MADKKKAKAKAVKKKKPASPFWAKLWNQVKFFLGCLVSNDRCVEGRTTKWYGPVTIAILSCILALAPVMTTYFSRQGSSFFTGSASYNYEVGLSAFTEKMDASKEAYPFTISEEGILLVDGKDATKNMANFANGFGTTLKNAKGEDVTLDGYAYSYTKTEIEYVNDPSADQTASSIPTIPQKVEKTVIDFMVYYAPEGTSAASYATSSILTREDPNKTLGYDESAKLYQTNFIVFGKESLYAAKKPAGTASAPASSIALDYKDARLHGKSLANLFTEDLYGNAYQSKMTGAERRDAILASWGQVFEAGWNSTRVLIGWQYTGIALAINVSITFVGGLMVFLMTRGKNNPFRTYTFWQSQKIAYHASAAPAILSLFGFIPALANFSIFLYMFLLGVRIFWMSMKTLRPYQN